MKNAFVENDIEILVATMNRTDLDFLSKMFPFKHFSNYNILIVNQSKTNVLSSDYPSIRVINTYDFGLSKSRNLALQNAVGKILIIADDDIIYQIDFAEKTIVAHNKLDQATVINFCAINKNGSYLKKYPSDSKKQLNTLDIFNTSSIEMTINKERLDLAEIRFDENFGLGGIFEMGEEAIFLFDLKHKNQQISFENLIFVEHKGLTSSDKKSIKERYYIYGAVLTRVLKNNYTYWLFLKLLFDLKQKKLKLRSFFKVIVSAKKGREKIQNIYHGK
jgi:glycosyltransferase involved in cell wall biosynthesis